MVVRVISRRKFICIGNSKMLPYMVVEFESHNFLKLWTSFQWIIFWTRLLAYFLHPKGQHTNFNAKNSLKKFIPLSSQGILFSPKVSFIKSRNFVSLCPWLLVQRMAWSMNVSSTSPAKSNEDVSLGYL